MRSAHPTTVASTTVIAQCDSALLSDGWDEVWSDYDLVRGATIRPVVELMLERVAMGEKPELGKICVHSSNARGAAWICAQLQDHYRVQRVCRSRCGASSGRCD